MPKRRTSYELPSNPTRDQIVVMEYLKAHSGLTVNEWASRAKVSEGTIRQLLTKPGATLHSRTKSRLASAIGKSVDEFFGTPLARKTYLVGIVGAGAEVHLFDGDSVQGMMEEVEAPPSYKDKHLLEALEIRGDSMMPFEEGWRVYYKPEAPRDPSELIGSLCVVKLRNGRLLVKKLLKGYAPGRFNLLSWNAPLMEDQEVVQATRVEAIVPVHRS